MRLATLDGKRRIYPQPRTRARCLTCDGDVVAKCGRIVVWHWAHVVKECDEWAEPDSQWHTGWQDLFPNDMREVVIGPHRADIVTSSGWVVELQHSSISTDDIRARERHYNRMVWVFDAREAVEECRLIIRREQKKPGTYRTFRWKHPRKSLVACLRPVFLDLGEDYMLRLGKIYPKAPCGGWGHLVTKESFIRQALSSGVQDAA